MPKIVNHREYRRDLLDKASVTFAGKNYADVSMRDIAIDLGVSTGQLYHYFPSKQELFCALFLHSAQVSASELTAQLCSIRNYEQKLDILFDYFLKRCEPMKRQFLFSTDMLRNDLPPKAGSLLRRWASELNRRLSSLLGVDHDTGLMIFVFLAGSLYGGFILPEREDLTPAFYSFKNLLKQNQPGRTV